MEDEQNFIMFGGVNEIGVQEYNFVTAPSIFLSDDVTKRSVRAYCHSAVECSFHEE